MPTEEKGTVVFGSESDPKQTEAYRARIARAQQNPTNALKSNTPVGTVPKLEGMPVLDRNQLPGGSDGMGDGRMPQQGVQPRPPGSPVVTPQTQSELQAFAKAQSEAVQKAKDEKAPDTENENILDLFDFGGRQIGEAERVLNNKKRRDEIEARLSSMSIDDLIMKDSVGQRIEIIPGKYTVDLRSVTETENLFIKIYLSDEKVQTDQYLSEKLSLCQLCCAVVAINGKELPPHLDQNGEPERNLFELKLKALSKKSGYIIADLGLQYQWFDMRVRKLLNPDVLGNG